MTDDLITMLHAHPIFRVVQGGWRDAVDVSYSRTRVDNRWNTADFPALYCCCSVPVARAVALDVFRRAAVMAEDLQPEARPALAKLSWTGKVVDIASADGVAAAGFPPAYPDGVSKEDTRRAASQWHESGQEGVVCRSASIWRRDRERAAWDGSHESWSELAIFPLKAANQPQEEERRNDSAWLDPIVGSGEEP
jgi:RES domain-containing protein